MKIDLVTKMFDRVAAVTIPDCDDDLMPEVVVLGSRAFIRVPWSEEKLGGLSVDREGSDDKTPTYRECFFVVAHVVYPDPAYEKAEDKGPGMIVSPPNTKFEAPPVDRSARARTDGGDPNDDAHKAIGADGMQQSYVVLTPEERAKGFVRPFRQTYVHDKCHTPTTMNLALSETYARDPKFYGGTFCTSCRDHFPVGADGEFTWKGTDIKVGT